MWRRLTGGQGAPPEQALAERQALLSSKLAEIDEILKKSGEEGGTPSTSCASDTASSGQQSENAAEEDRSRTAVKVTVGSSRMAKEDPTLIDAIVNMVNGSYGYRRIDKYDIEDRLRMGDPGEFRGNRVLHLAFLGAKVVGCMSSTFNVPWAEDGCGHWGLLVVDENYQGQGIASQLVAQAERRLAGVCEQIQIEYEYCAGDAFSERLFKWYEGKCGFTCVHGRPRGHGNEFRKCRKAISEAEQQAGRRRRLLGLRADIAAELATLQSVPTDSKEPKSGGYVTCAA
eukprot:TRINITY_DN92242_c0_g1_i1.p1 TRINITY_DN92242_c0_g1~~TRINITY_DN92242_c0_g1_i1.p1  ORF type:complete len:286 (+),score=63.61 TRINITY_DN92242_c0_g1_i1:96-953(+)